MSSPAPGYRAADFASQMMMHLPEGPIWPRDQGATLPAVMASLAPTYERLSVRAGDLLRDAFPATAVELLPEWEASLGLPDPCSRPEPGIYARQRQVTAKLTGRGGQSVSYYTAVAAALGYRITIREYGVSRFGRRFGLTFGGPEWAHAWQVRIAGGTVEPFLFGRNRFGERFRSWGNTELQCQLNRIKPAHTVLTYAYTGSAA